jgi:hypothetical protein
MGDSGPYRQRAKSDRGDLVAQLETAERHRAPVLDARRRLVETTAASTTAAAGHQAALRSLEDANSRLRELKSGRGSMLLGASGVTVYEFWLDLPGYSGPVRRATADVTQHGDVHQVSDVTGTTKSGLGGAVVGGLLLGPLGAIAGLAATRKNNIKTTIRTVDTRQFELRISGPGFAWSKIEGPECGYALRELRDVISARGSSTEDLSFVTSAQIRVVDRKVSAAKNAEAAYRSAADVAAQEERAHNIAWEQYVGARLPLLLDGRARWARASWVGRSVAILLGPLILGGWTISLAVAQVTHREDLTLLAGMAGAVHIAALLALIFYYVKRVRLQKARLASRDG